MQYPTQQRLIQGLAAAALATSITTATAHAEEEFIFANPMNTDHVFHAISERFMGNLGDDSGVSIAYHPGWRSWRLDIAV